MKNNYKVALLTVTQMDIGITALAGVLRDCDIPAMLLNLQTDEHGNPDTYPPEVVTQAIRLLEGVEFVGISVQDLFFRRALFMAEKIKEHSPKTVIIIGGVHAEIYPEECLKSSAVDAVCIGDGFRTIVDFVTNWHQRDTVAISNAWIKDTTGAVKKNPVLDYYDNRDLDATPLPDYTYDHYWMLHNGKIIWMKEYNYLYSFAHHQIGHKNTYVVSFMTGCIHNCLYCNNWTRFLKHEQFAGKHLPRVRYKSPERIIRELTAIKDYHDVRFFNIMDNDFCARPLKQIKEFSTRYKQQIGIPFYIMASPDTVSEEKINTLIEAGLVELNIGLQTIQRVNADMYNRSLGMDDDKIIAMTRLVNKYAEKKQIDVFYDFIIFNPAMTRDDLLEMINFIKRIPTPFDQVSHHLTLGPEVALYHKFKDENIVLPRDLRKMYESNYHEFNLMEYQEFPNLYLNLTIEWMAGRHDEKEIGRLPRNPKEFLHTEAFAAVGNLAPKVATRLEEATRETDDIRDFLLHPTVLSILEYDFDVLQTINDTLPEVLYSNQRNIGVYHD